MAFRFRLVDRNGRDLGVSEFATEVWKPGELIHMGAERTMRVVAVDHAPEHEGLAGTLTVEQVDG